MTARVATRRGGLRLLAAVGTLGALGACRAGVPDASGRFEAVEVTVSAEAAGRLLRFSADEGSTVGPGVVLGLVDTVALGFQRAEVLVRREALASRMAEADAGIAALGTQLALAERERGRVARLARDSIATAQQEDRAERDAQVLRDQLGGARQGRVTVGLERAALDAQLAVLDDRLRRCRVLSPVAGTVLVRYASAGEFVQPGTPLFKVASLDTLLLRAYVAEAQLGALRLGQTVEVRVDSGASALRTLPGRLTWISGAAEYTPTPIQTRDERVTQVYAVKVAVANPDGRLRIGMPGELVLPR